MRIKEEEQNKSGLTFFFGIMWCVLQHKINEKKKKTIHRRSLKIIDTLSIICIGLMECDIYIRFFNCVETVAIHLLLFFFSSVEQSVALFFIILTYTN